MLNSAEIKDRLEQWKVETTDRQHPSYVHADLDHASDIYSRVAPLVKKLRQQSEQLTVDEVQQLIGALNSGGRQKGNIVRQNSLADLKLNLLTLIDGAGDVSAKIAAASQQIRFAGASILGELYGWANPDIAPLRNGCAINALHYLGYAFDTTDYDAFVAAHEAFKTVYQAEVGQIRPELPLNLEVDRFYNVIDKVDLKANEGEVMCI